MRQYKTIALKAFFLFIILIVSFLVSTEIRETWQCRAIQIARDDSVSRSLALESKALKEWKSFPKYKNSFFGPEARDPDPNVGGRVYSTFDEYFSSEYSSQFLREGYVGAQIVVNNPHCFSPREVAVSTNLLND